MVTSSFRTGRITKSMLWRFTGVATIFGCFGLNMVKYKTTRVTMRMRMIMTVAKQHIFKHLLVFMDAKLLMMMSL